MIVINSLILINIKCEQVIYLRKPCILIAIKNLLIELRYGILNLILLKVYPVVRVCFCPSVFLSKLSYIVQMTVGKTDDKHDQYKVNLARYMKNVISCVLYKYLT
jgi:hypothetical protein